MILADTNVWVYSVDPTKTSIASRLADLLERGDVIGHDFVFGELLLGSGGPKRQMIIDRYGDLDQAILMPSAAILTFIKTYKVANKGIGLVDAHLLASARTMGAKLWTEEAALKKLAVEMGIAFDPSKE